MRVVTLPDGAESATVLASSGSPVFLGTADVSPVGGPFASIGGDTTGASTVVGPSTSEDYQTLGPFDTTGAGIAAVIVQATTSVNLVAAAQGECFFELIVDGLPASPRIGAQVAVANQDTVPVAFSGLVALSEGVHTLILRCTADANTTATINPALPGEGGTPLSSNVLLLFVAA